jgi:RNA polymerase sigma-70 factor (ECF subfamily)
VTAEPDASASDRIARERALQRAILAGDQQAWSVWYDEWFAPLYAFVARRCGGRRQWAEEIVQETWMTAVRRIGSFDPAAGGFGGWLKGIAAHVLKNHVRKLKRERKNASGRGATLQPVDALVIDATGLESAATKRVSEVLERLPERYARVLKAKYLDQKSVADIAQAWSESPKAIESLLVRARAAFRDRFLDEGSADDR